MKTMLIRLGIRSSSVGVATRQAKGDIIATLIERDRFIRGLPSPCACSGQWHDDRLHPLREAG